MNTDKLAEKWNSLTLKGKIIVIVILFVLMGLATRSWLLAIIAWGIIGFYAVKLILDLEML